jgi:hypothetical protein
MTDGGDRGRNEAQRQALSGVIARFTADRDHLLAAIQACQQRVSELVDRLGDDAPASEPISPSAETLVDRVAALEARVAQLEATLRELGG